MTLLLPAYTRCGQHDNQWKKNKKISQTMEDRKTRVAITHGDTNGIGYELIFKTFSDPAML